MALLHFFILRNIVCFHYLRSVFTINRQSKPAKAAVILAELTLLIISPKFRTL